VITEALNNGNSRPGKQSPFFNTHFKQAVTVMVAIAAVMTIYLFGNTDFYSKETPPPAAAAGGITAQLVEDEAKKHLAGNDAKHLQHLQEDKAQAKTPEQQLAANNALLEFWNTRGGNPDVAAGYLFEKAKLENSEKSLTFAANFLLNNAINDDQRPPVRAWKAGMAKELFEMALQRNPSKDSLKIGLGGCYMFGAGGSNPMTGISLIREVVVKDSTSAYAHKMLGFGNIENGQTDKAVDRFEKSVRYNPQDKGLLMMIPLLYKQRGDNSKAQMWYERVKKEIAPVDPAMFREFDEQFRSLK
jgi:tetratricopeptide (TPR) repeat protein